MRVARVVATLLCVLGVLRVDAALDAQPAQIPWGLDRIDQRALPVDGRFAPGGDGAGVAALCLQRRPHASPAEVKTALVAAATRDAVKNAGSAPPLLLHIIGTS